jgi:hypothetical protein
MLSTKWGLEFEIEVVAPRHGFEPRFTAPKAAVLPLDDRGSEGGIQLLHQFSSLEGGLLPAHVARTPYRLPKHPLQRLA